MQSKKKPRNKGSLTTKKQQPAKKDLSKKITIAIFDLTDCEGCEIRFIDLKEELYALLENINIVNWRLATDIDDPGPYDISFIEGTPLSSEEVRLLRSVRQRSKTLVALGACAHLGGVQAGIVNYHGYGLKTSSRNGVTEGTSEEIDITAHDLGKDHVSPAPLSHYVSVDIEVPGCPVDTNFLRQTVTSLIAGKHPAVRNFTVCMDCKERENDCVMLSGTLCLGPVTLGGCSAICVTEGRKCFGCYGPIKDANFDALYNTASGIGIKRKDVNDALDLFMSFRRRI